MDYAISGKFGGKRGLYRPRRRFCTGGNSDLIYCDDPLPGELLFSELGNNGQIGPDDFLGQARLALQELEIDECEVLGAEHALSISQIYKLLHSGYLDLENGISRASDGSLCIASITDLGGCTGDMFKWWINFCDNREKFRWWHPESNENMQWEETFYAVQGKDRKRDFYINRRQTVVIMLEGQELCFDLDFIDPAQYVNLDDEDTNEEEMQTTAFILAKINLLETAAGPMTIGHVCFQVRNCEGVNELRTRVLLGDIRKIKPAAVDQHAHEEKKTRKEKLIHFFAEPICNTSCSRYYFFPQSRAIAIQKYISEIGQCLRVFIPGLFAQRRRYYTKSIGGSVSSGVAKSGSKMSSDSTSIAATLPHSINSRINKQEKEQGHVTVLGEIAIGGAASPRGQRGKGIPEFPEEKKAVWTSIFNNSSIESRTERNSADEFINAIPVVAGGSYVTDNKSRQGGVGGGASDVDTFFGSPIAGGMVLTKPFSDDGSVGGGGSVTSMEKKMTGLQSSSSVQGLSLGGAAFTASQISGGKSSVNSSTWF